MSDTQTTVDLSRHFADKPDTDTSSMRGYAPGSSVFTPHAPSFPAPAAETRPYDLDTGSMRGFVPELKA